MGRIRRNILVCHSVAGRLRVKVPSLGRSREALRFLEERLNGLDDLGRAETRPSTGSLIITYDSKKTDKEGMLDLLDRVLKNSATSVSTSPKRSWKKNRKTRIEGILFGHLLNAIGLTTFMVYALVRRFIFKSPLSQAPFSLLGLVATAGTIPIVYRALKDIRERRKIGLFPFLSIACGLGVATGQAFTSLEIIWVEAVGMLLEEYAAERAKRGVREILQVTPEKAFVVVEGIEVETAVSKLRRGDIVAVQMDQLIPVDGAVVSGEALVDESNITGRSQPELRRRGHPVFAGTRIQQGFLHIRAEKTGEDTYLSRITHMVEVSLLEESDIEKRADVLASRLLRLGTLSTLATLLFTRNFTRSFAVMLVMSCPCATVLAASTAIAAAVSNAARRQILVKGGVYLERVSVTDCMCFDKTGTITSDTPQVVAILPRDLRQDLNEILGLAASAEAESNHPMARALLAAARSRGISLAENVISEEFLGRGVRAKVGLDDVVVGNYEFLNSEGISAPDFRSRAQHYFEDGQTVLYVARNGCPEGFITVANTPRPEAAEVLQWLRNDGVDAIYLISGDTEPIVRSVSQKLGFDGYQAAILPEQKADYIERLKAAGNKVVMVGDGVNDALALAKATVAVAMGSGGSEVAVETSDIALVRNDLKGLIVLRRLSHQTLKTIEQNFWIATATNILGLPLGAFGWFSPAMAGLLHVSHTLGIMYNSSRLIGWERSAEDRAEAGAMTRRSNCPTESS